VYGADAALEAFRRLADLGAVHALEVLSMGMSDDFGLALSCGATHLRLGSVLFGPRRDVRSSVVSSA
jgi:PLP dependent protein